MDEGTHMSDERAKLPILCVDFDGVFHRYSKGWQGIDNIYDPPTEGAFDWLLEVIPHFRVAVFSSRSADRAGRYAMRTWFGARYTEWISNKNNLARVNNVIPVGRSLIDYLEFPMDKPAAFLSIDDRCKRFDGDWRKFRPEDLKKFKPWTQDSDPMTSLT